MRLTAETRGAPRPPEPRQRLGARDCTLKLGRDRSTEDPLAERIDIRRSKMQLSSQLHMRCRFEPLGHVVPAYGRSPADEQSLDTEIFRCHFQRDVAAERPANHGDFADSEQTEHLY